MAKAQEVDGMKEWRLITNRIIGEETSRVDITTDDDGKPFECNELVVMAELRGNQNGVKPIFLLNKGWSNTDPYMTGDQLYSGWKSQYTVKAYMQCGLKRQEYNAKTSWNVTQEESISSYSIVAQDGNFAEGIIYIIGR